jgi:hypothetical protein
LVEVNQKTPSRDEAKLRLAVQGGEPSAAEDVKTAFLAPMVRAIDGLAWHSLHSIPRGRYVAQGRRRVATD